MTAVALATEDELSEAIGKRLLTAAQPALTANLLLRKNGAGYLRKNVRSWREMASRSQPLVLITDLDQEICAAKLISTWFGPLSRPTNLVFRVAVREVEAWLLADHIAMQRLFGKLGRLPNDPDALPDPKRFLLGLAKRASRPVREDLLAPQGAVAAQGLGYNVRLCALVERDWSPERAAQRSASLRRACVRINQLAQRLAR